MAGTELSIESVEWYVVKIPQPYRYSEIDDEVEFLPETDYFIEYDWDQAYSLNLESLLVKITTKNGNFGWGEIQSPLLPEVGATIVENLIGPAILGENARKIELIRERLYRLMNVRGHYQGFMVDAVSGIDIALWDLVGKTQDIPVSTLAGGRQRERLPAYVSLPGFTTEEYIEQAQEYIKDGFKGIKIFLGHGVKEDAAIVKTLREELGADPDIFIDCFWNYHSTDVERLSEHTDGLDVGFIEAPLQPEDITSHARLASKTTVPIAIGEPIRTRHEFKQWFSAEALDVAQPDVVRTGLTEAKKITDMAQTHGYPVAPHFGAALGIGMAATWHLASTISDLRIQEFQPVCFEETNEFLEVKLEKDNGELIVPQDAGLGIDIDEDALSEVVVDSGSLSR